MPFCSKCGASLNGRFCANCGLPNDVEAVSSNQYKPIQEAITTEQTTELDPADTSSLVRPEAVGLAIKLLYISLGIAALMTFVTIPSAQQQRPVPEGTLPYVVFALILFYGLWWVLIDKVSKGQNWARILYLVLIVVDFPFVFELLRQTDDINRLNGLISVGTLGLQVIALIFLFQQKSTEWFKQLKPPR